MHVPAKKLIAAKKSLLLALSTILFRDDELFPDDLDGDNPDEDQEYAAWDRARSDLAAEFERRGKGGK